MQYISCHVRSFLSVMWTKCFKCPNRGTQPISIEGCYGIERKTHRGVCLSICNETVLLKFTFFFFCPRSTSLHFSLSSNPPCCILSTQSCLSTEAVFLRQTPESQAIRPAHTLYAVGDGRRRRRGGGPAVCYCWHTLFNTSSLLNMEPWLWENMRENNKLPSYHFHWIGIKLPPGGVQHKHTRSDTHEQLDQVLGLLSLWSPAQPSPL